MINDLGMDVQSEILLQDYTEFGKTCEQDVIIPIQRNTNIMANEEYLFVMNGMILAHFENGLMLMDMMKMLNVENVLLIELIQIKIMSRLIVGG